MFKIQNPRTGLFSSGGQHPHWNRKGKTWNGIGPLKLHLGQPHVKSFYPNDTVVVEYEVVAKGSPRPLRALLDEIWCQKNEQQEAAATAAVKERERREIKVLHELREKYPHA